MGYGKPTNSYKTKSGNTVYEYKDGTKKYTDYDTSRKDGRKQTVIYKPKSQAKKVDNGKKGEKGKTRTTTETSGKTEFNNNEARNGRPEVGKQGKGKGTQIGHVRGGRSSTNPKDLKKEDASTNIAKRNEAEANNNGSSKRDNDTNQRKYKRSNRRSGK